MKKTENENHSNTRLTSCTASNLVVPNTNGNKAKADFCCILKIASPILKELKTPNKATM
ncbi:MAG: hypothetical protein K2X48_05835 [Chitinophagaceae bacterium]|nr:hypothetical protein [Chitinophagaceae bacterium]